MSRPRGPLARIAKAALWWGLGAMVLAILGGYFGSAVVRGVYPPYVPVEGISMLPLLHKGDLVALKHATVKSLKKGDVIAFQTTKTTQEKYDVPSHFVHKIYKVVHEPGGLIEFQTKGIHNPAPDGFLTPASMVIGEYDGYVPDVGYVALFVQSREGLILGGAIVIVIAIYILLGHLDERKAEREQITVDFATALEEMRGMVADVAEAVTPDTSPKAPRAGPTARAAPAPASDPVRVFVAGPAAPEPQEPVTDASRPDPSLDERVEALVGAVSEYGVHLRSHTAVMQHLATTTDRLEAATEGLLRAVETMGPPSSVVPGPGSVGSPMSVDELLDRASQALESLTRERDLLQERIAQLERDAATQVPVTPVAQGTSPALPPVWDIRPLPKR